MAVRESLTFGSALPTVSIRSSRPEVPRYARRSDAHGGSEPVGVAQRRALRTVNRLRRSRAGSAARCFRSRCRTGGWPRPDGWAKRIVRDDRECAGDRDLRDRDVAEVVAHDSVSCMRWLPMVPSGRCQIFTESPMFMRPLRSRLPSSGTGGTTGSEDSFRTGHYGHPSHDWRRASRKRGAKSSDDSRIGRRRRPVSNRSERTLPRSGQLLNTTGCQRITSTSRLAWISHRVCLGSRGPAQPGIYSSKDPKNDIHLRNVYYAERPTDHPRGLRTCWHDEFCAAKAILRPVHRASKIFQPTDVLRSSARRLSPAARLQSGEHAGKQRGVRITAGQRHPNLAHRHPNLRANLEQL